MPARGSEVERIQRWRRLLRLLSAEDPACRSRTALAAALEVAPASLGRDLKDLAKLGAKIDHQRGRGYRLARVFDPLVEVVTPSQAMALAFLAQSGANFATTPLAEGAKELARTIEASWKADGAANDLEWIRRSVRFTDMAKPRVEAAVWGPIAQAFRTGRRLRLEYQTAAAAGQRVPRRFDPWAIIVSSGVWFLYGLQIKGEQRDPRTLHFARIRAATVLNESSEKPPSDWDLDEYVAAGFGGLQADGIPPTRYRLRFNPHAASRARERRWPKGVILENQEDGSMIVTFEASLTEWVQREIASWRDAVEVLEPKSPEPAQS